MFSCWLRGARYNDCETKADFREFSGQEIIYDSLHEQFVSKVKSIKTFKRHCLYVCVYIPAFRIPSHHKGKGLLTEDNRLRYDLEPVINVHFEGLVV